MKHLLLIVILLSVSACTSTKNINSTTEPVKKLNMEQTEPSLKDRIYFYQHRLLPKWIFENNGTFYKDIMNGNLSRVKSLAEEVISSEYANSISAKTISKFNGALLTFPEPSNPPACYFIFIRQIDNKYLYITYEKTIDIANEGFIGVVGSWSPDGIHHNYGPRKYRDSDSFLSDAIQIK